MGSFASATRSENIDFTLVNSLRFESEAALKGEDVVSADSL